MSEFNLAMFDEALPEIEGFIKYLNRKRLTPETAKRLKTAGEAVKSLRSILETEKQDAEMRNAAEAMEGASKNEQ